MYTPGMYTRPFKYLYRWAARVLQLNRWAVEAPARWAVEAPARSVLWLLELRHDVACDWDVTCHQIQTNPFLLPQPKNPFLQRPPPSEAVACDWCVPYHQCWCIWRLRYCYHTKRPECWCVPGGVSCRRELSDLWYLWARKRRRSDAVGERILRAATAVVSVLVLLY
jgi:hypothetical protein